MVSLNITDLNSGETYMFSRMMNDFDATLHTLINSEKRLKKNKKTFQFILMRTRPRLYYRHHDIYDSNTRFIRASRSQ